MPISVKLSLASIAKDASSFLVKDTTGAYDATNNPGGYGSANNLITPTRGILYYRYWEVPDFQLSVLGTTEMTAILGTTGYKMLPSAGSVFPDGVHHLQYLPLNNTGGTGGMAVNTKIMNVTGYNITTVPAGTYTHVALFNGTTLVGKPMQIDWAAGVTSSSITTIEAFTGSVGAHSLWVGNLADLKLLINKAAEKCIVGKIGKLAEADCDCHNDDLLDKLIRWRFAADVKFDLKDYDGSHKLILSTGKACVTGDCNC